MLYNSAAHRSLIEAVIAKTGRFFHSMSPDVGSGVALAYVAGSYLSTEMPLSVTGTSKSSNGHALIVGQNEHLSAEFTNLGRQQGIEFHPWVPRTTGVGHQPAVADSFLTVQQRLFPNDKALRLDRRTLIKSLVEHCMPRDVETATCFMAELRDTLAHDPSLCRWFDASFRGRLPPRWQ